MNAQVLIPRTADRRYGRSGPSRFLRVALLLQLLLIVTPSLSYSQTLTQNEDCTDLQDNPTPLQTGEVLTRTMKPNERHLFRVSLATQQYVHAMIDQKGVDVVVKLLNPNRELVIERDTPNGKFGPEAVSAVAQLTGTYYLEICADKSQPTGSYELKVEGPRQGTPADTKRVDAERLLMEGRRLAQQRTAESRALAIEQFKNAASIFHELLDSREEGYAFSLVGETFRVREDFSEAMKYLNQALSLLNEASDESGQASVLNQMGAAYRDLDIPSKALDKYARAIELRMGLGDRWGEAQLRNNVGLVYALIGDYQNSVTNSELALALWRQLKDRAMEMNTLNNIAKANLELVNLNTAFQQVNEVLHYCSELNAPCFHEPFARNSSGVIHDTWGDPNEALTQYELALKIFRERGDQKNQVNTLNNMGMVYANIGDGPAALDAFQEALNVRSQARNQAEDAVTRSNLGYAYLLMDNPLAARKELVQAQQLSQSSDNPRFEAYTLVRLGMAHVALRQMDQAIIAYNKALEIQNRIEDRRGQAITLDKIGEFYNLLNQPSLALKNYRQAIDLWRKANDAQGEALSLYGIARLERNQNHLTEARDKIVEAIDKVESLRTKMTSHRLRMSYYATKQDFFELEIDVRMRLYNATRSRAELESALYAGERARARNLLDLLTESHAGIRQGVDPQLLAVERQQKDLLAEKLTQFQKLSGKYSESRKAAADKELQALTLALDQTQAEIRKRSPRFAALTQPQPLKPAQIQQLLDDDTLLLEYSLGEKRSYAWLVTKNDVLPYTLPGRAQIEQAAQSFRESLKAWEPKRPTDDTLKYIAKLKNAPQNYRRRALELSNIVLRPALSKIGKKRLVILADGALQYVPFGALLVPGQTQASADLVPLIVNNEIIYEPSATALALIREAPRPIATKTVAVFADPVFSKTDDRVVAARKDSNTEPAKTASTRELKRALRDAGDVGSVDGGFRLDRLSFSRGEADAIIAAAPAGSAMKALDFDASRARVLNLELKQYQIVHFATHGILNGNHPELSGLVFSLVDEHGQTEDGFLKLSDIYNLDLPLDLIVLSACQTAVGKQVRGEGLIGLTRGFMYAGALRVVASLWNVQDEATAELMKRFYNYLLEKKMPAAAALRRAQLDLIERHGAARPYYWAGFVLQGDWK
ncbi:MAG TPA: CHAT domain-containing tetratricopeptide repeat protein [Pyrinomonadaceae bacterium]|nr:CHAT domain-containing tetratricopeptide repeat protein [Pyrinomonadaceae bacterium]